MLIAYGISKGVMSSLADKASPKVFMACGTVLCAIVNVGLGFSTTFWVFAALVVLNGLFQGMGVGPSFITIANWFPRRERGRVGAFWNISHNVGGGIAPDRRRRIRHSRHRALAERQLHCTGLRGGGIRH